LKKYASPEDYNFTIFNNDIKENLFRKSKEEKIEFSELSSILDGKKASLSLINRKSK
jgi:hypothetical protein